MNNYFKIIILTLIPFIFQSCLGLGVGSSKFSCPMPETLNLKCMPPSEIYLLSEKKQLYKLQKENKEKRKDKKEKSKCNCQVYKKNEKIKQLCNKFCSKKIQKNKIVLNQDDVDFLPVLSKPKIILIWFNYWIDNSGDLHSNEYVYVTVKKRHWSVGQKLFNQNKLLLNPLVDTEFLQNSINKSDVFSINKKDK